ncbi:MAG: response regulator [Anaerolineae bacterium]|nr:response regulator [Anaerolineae bacterium]
MFKVLVVDDEEGFLQIIQVVLSRAGYDTIVASDGKEGLEMTYSHRPDVIILDDMMPGLTGGEVCIHLKNDQKVNHIPVIMYSAGAKVRNPEYIRKIGADGVLFKPSLPGEIIETVASFTNARVS